MSNSDIDDDEEEENEIVKNKFARLSIIDKKIIHSDEKKD